MATYPVTMESHKNTHMVVFDRPQQKPASNFITCENFHQLLETVIEQEFKSPASRRCAHRTRDHLLRILEQNPTPPMHYPQDQAVATSWRNEIGCKSDSKRWRINNNQVFHISEKTGQPATVAETPTEEWYAMFADIHNESGHLSRDNLFADVSRRSNSISKKVCAAYSLACCPTGQASVRGSRKRSLDNEVPTNSSVTCSGSQSPRKRLCRQMIQPTQQPTQQPQIFFENDACVYPLEMEYDNTNPYGYQPIMHVTTISQIHTSHSHEDYIYTPTLDNTSSDLAQEIPAPTFDLENMDAIIEFNNSDAMDFDQIDPSLLAINGQLDTDAQMTIDAQPDANAQMNTNALPETSRTTEAQIQDLWPNGMPECQFDAEILREIAPLSIQNAAPAPTMEESNVQVSIDKFTTLNSADTTPEPTQAPTALSTPVNTSRTNRHSFDSGYSSVEPEPRKEEAVDELKTARARHITAAQAEAATLKGLEEEMEATFLADL